MVSYYGGYNSACCRVLPDWHSGYLLPGKRRVMAITDDLLDFMPDTIPVEVRTGQDVRGKPIYSAAVNRTGRLTAKGERLMDDSGQEFVSRGYVNFAGVYGIRMNDRLTLPSDFDLLNSADTNEGVTVLVRKQYTARDEDGPHHQKVWL